MAITAQTGTACSARGNSRGGGGGDGARSASRVCCTKYMPVAVHKLFGHPILETETPGSDECNRSHDVRELVRKISVRWNVHPVCVPSVDAIGNKLADAHGLRRSMHSDCVGRRTVVIHNGREHGRVGRPHMYDLRVPLQYIRFGCTRLP